MDKYLGITRQKTNTDNKNKTEHFIFVTNKDTKLTQNCAMINSNGRLRRDQWSSSQAATQANILIKFKKLQ